MRTRTTSPTSSRVRTSRARSSKAAQFHQCDGLVKSWACSVKRLARLSREVGYVLHLGIHWRRVVTELPRRLLRQETGSRYTQKVTACENVAVKRLYPGWLRLIDLYKKKNTTYIGRNTNL